VPDFWRPSPICGTENGFNDRRYQANLAGKAAGSGAWGGVTDCGRAGEGEADQSSFMSSLATAVSYASFQTLIKAASTFRK
jgi:hypothetical protein